MIIIICRRSHSSGAPPRSSDPQERALLETFVEALLEATVIEPARHGPFLSYPFLVPKAGGTARFIVNFSHLTDHLPVPKLHLPLFSTISRSCFLLATE